jgi:thioredoxin-related protein/YHS domain-containing protein
MPRLVSLSVIASLVFFALPVQAQELLRWETDLASAQKQAAASNRLVLVHFWGPWCPPCMEMEKTVFSRPNLGTAINPWYVAVKVRVEEGMNQDVAKQFGVDGYPCDIVMTPQGQILAKEKGYKPVEKYVAMLNEIAQKGLAQARSNGLSPVAAPPAAAVATPPAATPTAPPVSARPSPDAGRYGAVPPPDTRYAAYAPPVTAQVAPPTAAPAGPSRAATPPADDRYAAYYQSRGVAAPSAPAAPVATAPVVAAPVAPAAATIDARYATPNVAAPAAVVPSAVADSSAPVASPPATPAVAAPAASTPVAAAPNTTAAEQTAVAPPKSAVASNAAGAGAATSPKSSLADKLPPGSPPLALEGYCPVTVIEKMVWKQGDPLYGAIHLNRTYLFPSAEQQAKFLANPDRYSPIISGNDPVVALEKNEIVSGRRQFGLVYENRMILFSSKESYDKFCKESKRYTTDLQQALQSSNAIRR